MKVAITRGVEVQWITPWQGPADIDVGRIGSDGPRPAGRSRRAGAQGEGAALARPDTAADALLRGACVHVSPRQHRKR